MTYIFISGAACLMGGWMHDESNIDALEIIGGPICLIGIVGFISSVFFGLV